MDTPPSCNHAAIQARARAQVTVTVEELPGGCLLYRLEWTGQRQY